VRLGERLDRFCWVAWIGKGTKRRAAAEGCAGSRDAAERKATDAAVKSALRIGARAASITVEQRSVDLTIQRVRAKVRVRRVSRKRRPRAKRRRR
jgi:hypothetical protein